MKAGEWAAWSLGLGAAGVASFFVWRQFFQRTEAEPSFDEESSMSEPATGETKTATGYVKGQPTQITLSSVGNGKFARSDTAGAFRAMQAAAKSAGISLEVVSGFRTQEEQTTLYARYKAGTGNLAAPPGYSNHQGGLSLDLNTGGKSTPAYLWLKENAARFGFKNDVPSEHWHWTFQGAASFSGALAGLGAASGSSSSSLASSLDVPQVLIVGGLAALVAYQFLRKDEGPRTLRIDIPDEKASRESKKYVEN